MITTTAKKTAIYCRVSTDIQRERETISTQRKRLKDYCEREEISHVEEYVDDGFSGGDLDRPQMNRLLKDIREGEVGIVLVTDIDRLSRNQAEDPVWIGVFEKHDVRLVAINQGIDIRRDIGDGYADFNLKTRSFIGDMERDRIRSRVRFAMYQRVKEGKWNGGIVPFGYTTFGLEVKKLMRNGMDEDHARIQARKICAEEKKLYVYESEAKVVKIIFDKFLESNSLGIVRNFLNNKGMLTRNGELWARNSVSRILKTPIYIGQMWYGKRKTARKGKSLIIVPKESWHITSGNQEAIVSKEVFDKVNLMLAQKKKARLRFDTKYLLAGILKCAKCACGMQGKSTMKKDGKIHAYYRCYTRDQRGDCDTRPVKKELIEKQLIETILALYEGQRLMEMKDAMRRHNQHLEKSKGPLADEIKTLEKRNEQIGKKKTVLYEMVEEGTISRTEFKNRMNQISAEYDNNLVKLQDLQQRFAEARVKTVNFSQVFDLVNSLPAIWKKANFTQRKAILQRLIKEVRFRDIEIPLTIEMNLSVGDIVRTGIHSEHTANRPLSHFLYTIQVKLPKPYEQIKPLSFGDRLRYVRMKKGLRQADMANVIGVTKDCLGRWERMRNKPLSTNITKINGLLKLNA